MELQQLPRILSLEATDFFLFLAPVDWSVVVVAPAAGGSTGTAAETGTAAALPEPLPEEWPEELPEVLPEELP